MPESRTKEQTQTANPGGSSGENRPNCKPQVTFSLTCGPLHHSTIGSALTDFIVCSGAGISPVHAWLPEFGGFQRPEGVPPERTEYYRP